MLDSLSKHKNGATHVGHALDANLPQRAEPRYPENDLPAYTPEYGKKVDGYYGLDR